MTVLDPGTGALGSKGEWGVGRLPEPAELLAAVEALVPAGAAAVGRPATCWSPRAAPASRSTPCASSATAPAAGWASRWPRRPPRWARDVTLVAANVDRRRRPRGALRSTSAPPPSCRPPARPSSPAADVLLMAAAVADFRPAAPADTKLKKDRRATLTLELEADAGHPQRAGRRAAAPGQTLVGFAAEHGEGAVEYGRGKLARKGLDAIVVNDIARADIGFEGARQRGHDRHRSGRAPRRRAPRRPRSRAPSSRS